MQGRLFEDAAFGVGEGVDDDEGRLVDVDSDVLDSADFEARHDAEENILLHVSPAAPSLVNRHAATEHLDNRLPDFLAVVGDDGDGGVFLDAVNQEVNRFRRREVARATLRGGREVCRVMIPRSSLRDFADDPCHAGI